MQLKHAVDGASANGGYAKRGVVRGGGSVEESIAAGEVAGLEPEFVCDAGGGSGIGTRRRCGEKVVAEASVSGFKR